MLPLWLASLFLASPQALGVDGRLPVLFPALSNPAALAELQLLRAWRSAAPLWESTELLEDLQQLFLPYSQPPVTLLLRAQLHPWISSVPSRLLRARLSFAPQLSSDTLVRFPRGFSRGSSRHMETVTLPPGQNRLPQTPESLRVLAMCPQSLLLLCLWTGESLAQ